MWEIIDNTGTIYSGHQEEMECIWDKIINENTNPGILPDEITTISEWKGDLKLIQVHNIYK